MSWNVTFKLGAKKTGDARGKVSQSARGNHKRPASRIARQLALAHHVDRLIEAGALSDYASAATALGITRARMTQIMNLKNLSPRLQARILVDSGTNLPVAERPMRRLAQELHWEEQTTMFVSSDTHSDSRKKHQKR